MMSDGMDEDAVEELSTVLANVLLKWENKMLNPDGAHEEQPTVKTPEKRRQVRRRRRSHRSMLRKGVL